VLLLKDLADDKISKEGESMSVLSKEQLRDLVKERGMKTEADIYALNSLRQSRLF
jgi:hypothetical protein